MVLLSWSCEVCCGSSFLKVCASTPRLTLNDSKLVVFSGDRLYDPWLAPLLWTLPRYHLVWGSTDVLSGYKLSTAVRTPVIRGARHGLRLAWRIFSLFIDTQVEKAKSLTWNDKHHQDDGFSLVNEEQNRVRRGSWGPCYNEPLIYCDYWVTYIIVFKLTAGNINVIARNFLQTFASEQVMGWGGAWRRRQMSPDKMQGHLARVWKLVPMLWMHRAQGHDDLEAQSLMGMLHVCSVSYGSSQR